MSDGKTINSISDLTPDALNANKGTERGQYMVEHSLSQYGAGRSILVDKDGVIIAGNKTLQAAEDLGIPVKVIQTDGKELVVVQRTDLDLLSDDERARLMAYADNRASEVGLDWNPEALLADMTADLDLSDMFREEELKDILGDLMPEEDPPDDAGAQVDKAEELRQKWGVELGDLWQLGDHRLICGDCTDGAVVERVMGGETAGAVVTDPPYGQNQPGVNNDEPGKLDAIVGGAVGCLPVDNAIIVAFQSPRTFPVMLDASRQGGFKFERMLWLYKAAQCTFPWRGWILTSESILVFSVGDADWQEVHPFSHDCYYLPEVSGELDKDSGWHGSVKPMSVVSDIVSRVSAKGSIVFDGFLGSGTTLIACECLNRHCRAIEISPAYCAVAIQRWVDMTEKEPQRLSDLGLQPRLAG